MSPLPNRARQKWQELLTSQDMFSDLGDIYTFEFLEAFTCHFDSDPTPIDLFQGVERTGRAYIDAKWRKQVDKSMLLKYSGVHLLGAGLSARRLSEELGQVAKSTRANQNVQDNLRTIFNQSDIRPCGKRAFQSSSFRNGPQLRLAAIQELASALAEAIGAIVSLPEDYADEKAMKYEALDWVDEVNDAAQKTLSKNYAMEEAARAFKPTWEEFSSVAYRRGRYHHDIGGYDCKAGNALFAIITKLDTAVAPSLAGTAIENLRSQLKRE